MISQKTIGEIFDRMDVLDVVQEFVSLKKRGVNYIGLCPFHNEKTPSFTVSPSKNIYKCFGCGKGGNGIDFVMEHEAFSYPEALRFVAKLYNIDIEETYQAPENAQEWNRRDALQIVNDFAEKYFEENLWETDAGKSIALSYLKDRGFIKKTIQAFHLGYAPRDRDQFSKLAQQKSYKKEYLKELGLMTQHEQDFFFDRIIFPIHSLSGKPIAFAGRLLQNRTNSPKYLNSPESDIYQKRKVLFGLDLARKAIRSEGICFLVEGYTDVMMMHQNGIENVVATSGTALTSEQIRMIKRYCDTIHLIFDGDAAGVKATERAIDLILAEGMNVRILPLPEGQDPDEFVRAKGNGGFKQYASEYTEDFLPFKMNKFGAKANDQDNMADPILRAEMIRDLLDTVSIIEDGIKRHLYVRQISKSMEVPEQTLMEELHIRLEKRLTDDKKERLREMRRANREHRATTDTSEARAPVKEENILLEKDIIRVLLQHGHKPLDEEMTVAEFVIDNISDVIEFIRHEGYKKILDEYLAAINRKEAIDFEYFNRAEDPELRKTAIDVHTSKYDDEYSPNWIDMWDMDLQTQPVPEKNQQKDVRQALMRYKLRKAVDLCASNREKIEQLQKEGRTDDVYRHLVVQQKLIAIRDSIAREFNTIVLKGTK